MKYTTHTGLKVRQTYENVVFKFDPHREPGVQNELHRLVVSHWDLYIAVRSSVRVQVCTIQSITLTVRVQVCTRQSLILVKRV